MITIKSNEALIRCDCSDTGASRNDDCMNKLGFADLASLYSQGVRLLVLWRDVCKCSSEIAEPEIFKTITYFNLLCQSRNLNSFGIAIATKEHKRKFLHDQKQDAKVEKDRRAFLRSLIRPVSELYQIPEDQGKKPEQELVNFLKIHEQTLPVLYPFSPVFEKDHCVGCDACLNVCPHYALQWLQGQDQSIQYISKPSLCTGCGLCEEVCNYDAISVKRMAQKAAGVPLVEFRCSICGIKTHRPPKNGSSFCSREDQLCHICEVTDHHSKLHQVLS